jgi:hypothetical protein
MGVEDQQEEREVLESIFPEEITGSLLRQARELRALTVCTDVSETEFRIAIKLDDGRHEDYEGDDEERTSSHVYQDFEAYGL